MKKFLFLCKMPIDMPRAGGPLMRSMGREFSDNSHYSVFLIHFFNYQTIQKIPKILHYFKL